MDKSTQYSLANLYQKARDLYGQASNSFSQGVQRVTSAPITDYTPLAWPKAIEQGLNTSVTRYNPQTKQTIQGPTLRESIAKVPLQFTPQVRQTYQSMANVLPVSQPVRNAIAEVPTSALSFGFHSVARPIVQGGYQAIAPNSTPLERGLGALQAGSAAFSPTQPVWMAGLNTLKGGVNAYRKGGNARNVGEAALKGLTGEEFTPLGSSLTDDPVLSTALNVAEFVGPFAYAYRKDIGNLAKRGFKGTQAAVEETQLNNKARGLFIDHENTQSLIKANNAPQGKKANGYWDNKVQLKEGVGGGLLDKMLGYWETDGGMIDGKMVILKKTTQEILDEKIPISKVIRPANDVAMRALAKANSGGFVNPSAIIGKDTGENGLPFLGNKSTETSLPESVKQSKLQQSLESTNSQSSKGLSQEMSTFSSPKSSDINVGDIRSQVNPTPVSIGPNTLKGVGNQDNLNQTVMAAQKEPNTLSFPQPITKDIPKLQPTMENGSSTSLLSQSPKTEGQTRLQAKSQSLSSSPSEYFNTKTYKITDEGKKVVEQAVEQAKPRLEKIVGKTLSNKEVLQTADQSSKTLTKAVGRDQTLEWESALLKARQKLSALSEKGVVDKEYIDTLMTIKSLGTDIGRKLQSFSIGADPKLLTSKQAILEAVLKATDDSDAVLKAAQGVDFNDLGQATTFYRQFIKPSVMDHLDLLRYNSMLSSPNTHINNIASNFQGTGLITPIEKTVTGSLDALKSAFTGSPREYAVGEGAAYAKGYYSNVSNAVKNFTDVMTGKSLADNPDIRNIPMYPKGGPMGRVENALSFPMKLLEASDKFFTALTEGGETAAQKYKQSKGISLKGLTPDEAAAKRLFRSKLGDNQGSKALNTIDALANVVQSAKTSKDRNLRIIANFSLPFLRTPTNILKQGLEYNPLGVITAIGAENKTEQLSKALIGSAGVGMAMLLGSDRLTAGEPTSEKQKNAFRAAGMQPYAVKIGNNWVSYSKLHPAVSFPLAMVSSIRDAVDKKKLDEGQAETALNGVAKFLKFFADQSYLKNLGDIIASNQGDIEGPTRVLSNYGQQLIPFRALMGWVTRLTDPYQRQVDKDGSALDKQLQQLATQIPLVSQSVPARKDMFDNPIPNQNPVINAFSPAKVTTEQPKAREEYNFLKEKARLQSESTQMKNQLKSEAQNNVSVQKVGAAEDTFVPGTNKTPLPTFGGQSIKDAQVNKPTPLSSQEKDRIGTYIQYGKSVSEKDLSNYFYGDMKTQASTSPYENALHSKEMMSKLSKIENNQYISDTQKQYLVKQGLSDIGISPQDYEYYKVSKQSSDLKSLYANEQLSKLLSTPGTTPNTVNNWLINGRKTVNGEQLLNDSVIKSLVDSGVIGKADGDYLKKVTVENGQVKVKASASKKPKKLKLTKLKKIKVKKVKQIKLKPISLKLKVKKLKAK